MLTDFIVNSSGVSLILTPENSMEEELLKQLTKQDNSIVEIRTAVPLINKSVQSGIMIGKKTNKKEEEDKADGIKEKDM